MKCGLTCLLLVSVLVTSACQQARQPQGRTVAAPISSTEDESVRFEVRNVSTEGTHHEWLCIHKHFGKTAQFRVQLEQECAKSEDVKNTPICFGKGKFFSLTESDSSQLLQDLQKALHAKNVPSHLKRLPFVQFDYVNLGENMSRLPQGGFAENPRGDWTAMKLFLGKGEDEAEIFFNINAVAGQGEFSIKDEDYGDAVLKELASVL
jgi:hypothetical protein